MIWMGRVGNQLNLRVLTVEFIERELTARINPFWSDRLQLTVTLLPPPVESTKYALMYKTSGKLRNKFRGISRIYLKLMKGN
jgi:hypothetical protein